MVAWKSVVLSLDKGWMNASAISHLDVNMVLYGTLLIESMVLQRTIVKMQGPVYLQFRARSRRLYRI